MAQLSVGDLYGAAPGAWARGAELVYGPLADALVATSPQPLADRLVLDVGAGTGAGSRALRAVGARVVAADLSCAMLAHERAARPPAVAGDLFHLPVRDRATDAVLAPFVVNHVDAPTEALAALARAVRPGGVVLASTFAERDRPPLKDVIDGVAVAHGCRPPPAYEWVRAQATRVGSRDAMAAAARRAGLVRVEVFEGSIDTGVSDPADLVRYRFGMPQTAAFLATLPADEQTAIFDEAVAAVRARHDGAPMAPAVVFLSARVA